MTQEKFNKIASSVMKDIAEHKHTPDCEYCAARTLVKGCGNTDKMIALVMGLAVLNPEMDMHSLFVDLIMFGFEYGKAYAEVAALEKLTK